MEYLKVNKILACATIRSNRKYLPTNLMKAKELQRGSFDFRMSSQEIAYYKWMDNTSVHVVSNFHGTALLRTQKDGSRKYIYMGGVNKADMLCSIYGLDRISKKWWHRISLAW